MIFLRANGIIITFYNIYNVLNKDSVLNATKCLALSGNLSQAWCRNSTTQYSFSARKNELLVGQRPTMDLWRPKGPLKYLGGRRPLKVPFS